MIAVLVGVLVIEISFHRCIVFRVSSASSYSLGPSIGEWPLRFPRRAFRARNVRYPAARQSHGDYHGGTPRRRAEERKGHACPRSRAAAAWRRESTFEKLDRGPGSKRSRETDRAECLCCLDVPIKRRPRYRIRARPLRGY